VTSILGSVRGPIGFTESRSMRASSPESLRRIAHFLDKQGFTTNIEQGAVTYRPRRQAVLSTTTGWLLTWWRLTSRGLESSGRLWVADGVVPVTPSTLEQMPLS